MSIAAPHPDGASRHRFRRQFQGINCPDRTAMESTGGRRRNLRCFPLGRLQADLYLGSGRVDARSGQRIECEWSCVGSRAAGRDPLYSPLQLLCRCRLRCTPYFAGDADAGGNPAGGPGADLPGQSAAQCRAGAAARNRRDRPDGGRGLPAADHGHADRRPAGGAGAVSRQHRADRHAAHLDHRPHGVADLVQRLQDRQYRAPVRGQCALGARGPAQCRPGRAARRGDRLHQRARQPDPGGSPAHQCDVSARGAWHHPQASRCRRRDPDRRGAGRGPPKPRARRSQCGGGQPRDQPGDLCAGDRCAARPAGARRAGGPVAAAHARGGGGDQPEGSSRHYGRDVRHRCRPARHQDRGKQPVAQPVGARKRPAPVGE